MIRKNVDFAKTKNITVLEFGNGTINMASAVGEDYSSILLKSDKKRAIGAKGDGKGKNSDWFKPEIVMTFTNVGSIDVLIEKLMEAKYELVKKELEP